jgi:hypothetical protein
METVESRTVETPASPSPTSTVLQSSRSERRSQFPWISWGAIFGGVISGLGSYILLALFGVAVGLTAITPETARPIGNVPIFTGIWTSISLVLAAFVGGYVAARMSGFSRLADGILHGMVAWGASTLVFAYLVTTSVGAVLGGAFSVFGKTVQTVAGGAAVTAGGMAGSSQANRRQFETLVKGSAGGGKITPQSLSMLRDRLASGDRDGAISIMTGQMGFTQSRATQIVDRGMAMFGNAPAQARQTAESAVSGLSRITWALFAGVLISLALGIGGGVVGSRAAVKRRHPLPTGMAH